MKSIAIDFGGSSVKAAAFCDGKIVRRDSVPVCSEKGLKPVLPAVEKLVKQLAEPEGLGAYQGIGIAMPGIVDARAKRVTGIYEKYPDCKTFDFEEWCWKAFSLPMFLGMDSRMALLGEMHFGCARGFQDAVMMILGTGVGTAVAIDGKLLDGRNHVAGSLASHIILEMDGDKCTCPNRGCHS